MKTLRLCFAALLLPAAIYSQTIIPAGSFTGPFTLAGSPYIITGDVNTTTLVIDPGVDIRFQSGTKMWIYNSITAIGTALQPIIFEADDTTGWADTSIAMGGYKGVAIIGPSAGTSVFDHCIFRDMKSKQTDLQATGLYAYATNFTLTNSEVYHNFVLAGSSVINVVGAGLNPQITDNYIHNNQGNLCGGVQLDLCHGVISGNEFYHNYARQGAAIASNSNTDPTGPMIENNYIHHNRSSDRAGGIMIGNGRATIKNNNISFNHSAKAGSGIYTMNSHPVIIGNLVCNNSDSLDATCGIVDGGGGICVDNGSPTDTAELYNNVIANNTCWYSGGGLRVVGNTGYAIIENNHIINNESRYMPYSGGLEFSTYIHASVRNNIIWGNRTNSFLVNDDSVQVLIGGADTLGFEYNCIEFPFAMSVHSSWTYVQMNGNAASNIYITSVLPGFANPTVAAGVTFDATLADWHLTASSPCINTGTTSFLATPPQPVDYYLDPRLVGFAIDIGAVEFPTITGAEEHSSIRMNVFPNPASEFVQVEGCNAGTTIRITNVLGEVVVEQLYGNGIDISLLNAGVYSISYSDHAGQVVSTSFVKN